MLIKLPTPEQWNKMLEDTGLEREYALSSYVGEIIELEGKFVRLGNDKKTHIPNCHALIEDITFFDKNELRYKGFSHFWINNATQPFYYYGNLYYNNPIWYQIPQNSKLRIRGLVGQYWDEKNKAYKITLTNVIILSVNGYTIAV